MSVLLGCIADDFTGASDVASFLVESGMSTVVMSGVPENEFVDLNGVDAVVIALKSRTEPVHKAVGDSLAAASYLSELGCTQYYFKYCSTFDSTPKGNIGPVLDALMEFFKCQHSVVCPALPVNGRTVYNGHLFVNGKLLNQSGMEFHPLTPMTDSNVVNLLKAQSKGEVSLVPLDIISQGPIAILNELDKLSACSTYTVTDAINMNEVYSISRACRDFKLISGGSGLAIGLAQNFKDKGHDLNGVSNKDFFKVNGGTAILSGSCSRQTRLQVKKFKNDFDSIQLDPIQIEHGAQTLDSVTDLFFEKSKNGSVPVLIYATAEPEVVNRYKSILGDEHASKLLESFMSELVANLAFLGIKKFISAGGETSGAIVQALNVNAFRIGLPIDPGVPKVQSNCKNGYLLALKSGNFGSDDFFIKAFKVLNEGQ